MLVCWRERNWETSGKTARQKWTIWEEDFVFIFLRVRRKKLCEFLRQLKIFNVTEADYKIVDTYLAQNSTPKLGLKVIENPPPTAITEIPSNENS